MKPVGNVSAEGWQNGTCKYTLLFRTGFCRPSSGKVTFWYLSGHEQQAVSYVWGHRVAFGKFQVETLVPQRWVHSAQATDNCRHPAAVLGVCVTSQDIN